MTAGVYFIGPQQGEHVKIGHASDVKERLSQNQTGNPFKLHVLALIPAESKTARVRLEKEIHNRFLSAHCRGEWFYRTKEIQAMIRLMRRKHGEAPSLLNRWQEEPPTLALRRLEKQLAVREKRCKSIEDRQWQMEQAVVDFAVERIGQDLCHDDLVAQRDRVFAAAKWEVNHWGSARTACPLCGTQCPQTGGFTEVSLGWHLEGSCRQYQCPVWSVLERRNWEYRDRQAARAASETERRNRELLDLGMMALQEAAA